MVEQTGARPAESQGTKRRLTLRACVVLLMSLLLAPPHGSAEEPSDPHIIHFTPQGTVKAVRQVSVRFSEAMIPLGDPRGVTEPFEIACPERGTARWVDSRNWVYDFERDLPAGVRCTFRARPGLTSLTGRRVVGQEEYAFSTGAQTTSLLLHLPHV
jgi:hypothetical protein